jgi:methylmalonyl-CoA/ethylmalonyl-CoA epimerase
VAIQRIDNIGIAVRDVARVAAFFADQVGLPVTLDRGTPPSAQVTLGAQYLYLFQTTSDTPAGHRDPTLQANVPGLDHISFTVDDVDQTFAELHERGIVFETKPTTVEAWGLRMASFRDPEGNCYYLVRPLRERD